MYRRLLAVSAFTLALAGAVVIVQAQQPGRPAPPPPVPQPAAGESLDGTWELVSVIDDGKVVPLDVIRQTMIKDARVVIKGPVAGVVRPDGKLQTLAFVTDPTATPKTLDVAGALRVGGKGIYMRDGDTLMICVRGSDGGSRPTVMASLPETDTFLMTFRKVEAPAPAKLPPPPPPERPGDQAVRNKLVGTWGHQTDDTVVYVTLNADDTFSASTRYKKGFKHAFDREDRLSGKWDLKGGALTMTVTASTLPEKKGQVYSYRVTSISDSEVLYVDNSTGQRRIEWKLR